MLSRQINLAFLLSVSSHSRTGHSWRTPQQLICYLQLFLNKHSKIVWKMWSTHIWFNLNSIYLCCMYGYNQCCGSTLISVRIHPEPAFKLNANPDLRPGGQLMRNHADPDPCQTLLSLKVEFILEKYTLVGVPRRLFITALQWIAIAQGPKISQKKAL